MCAPARIVAIRHGQTAWNAQHRIQGHVDIALDDVGQRQAARVARVLAQEPVQAVYASDLMRAFETARVVAAACAASLHTEPGLRERHLGDFQGKTSGEIQQQMPEVALYWNARDPDFCPPGGGESLRQMHARVIAAVNRIAACHCGEQVVLVTHGGVLDILYREATGAPLHAKCTWMLENTAINRLEASSKGLTLHGWADTSHLEETSDDFVS